MGEKAPLPLPEPENAPDELYEGEEAKIIHLPPVSDEERDRIRREAGERAILSHRIGAGGMDFVPGSTTVSKGGKRRRGDGRS